MKKAKHIVTEVSAIHHVPHALKDSRRKSFSQDDFYVETTKLRRLSLDSLPSLPMGHGRHKRSSSVSLHESVDKERVDELHRIAVERKYAAFIN